MVELYGEFPDRLRGDRWQPAADVFETAEEVIARFEVAGVAGGDLRVNVEGSVLRVRGVRKPPAVTSGGGAASMQRLQQMEISFGPFEREITIESPFEADRVRARLEDGFLEVRIPKRETAKRKLEIESD